MLKFKQIDTAWFFFKYFTFQWLAGKGYVYGHQAFCICKGPFKIILGKGRQPSKKHWEVPKFSLVAGMAKEGIRKNSTRLYHKPLRWDKL